MKYHKAIEESTTDVNGAWKPLKPLSEGFEFVGDDQYDNFLTKKSRERRDVRQQGRASGLTRKEARRDAKNKIPTNKPARREAYLTLVKINFRGFAYKLDAIINGTNTNLLNQLKEKWSKWGEWNKLLEAVNKGKEKKPFVCGAKCRKEVLDATKFYNAEPISTSVVVALLGLAGVVVTSLSSVVKQGQIGKQQRDAIEASEKQGQEEFENLPPEEKKAILEAEAKLRKEIEGTDNKKYIYIGIGVVGLIGIIYLITKNK
jgi:hypothetical protein